MYDPRHSPEDAQAMAVDALGDAMLYISATLRDRTATTRAKSAALKALAQLTLALNKRAPSEPAQLAGCSRDEIEGAVADLVRRHDSPELRRLLAAEGGAISLTHG